MPPILALLLGGLFVVFLLRYDHKISGAQSWVMWLPTLWMLRCASVPFDTWFDMRSYRELGASVEAGNPFDRNVLILLIAAGVLVLLKRGINLRAVITDNKWFFILLIYMLVSISWSDYQLVSLKRWFKVSGDLVMALIVLTEISPVKSVETILRRSVYITVPFSLVLVKYYPHFGVDFGRYTGEVSWSGVAAGKNSLGVLCVFAIMIVVKDWMNKVEPAERANALEKGALFGLLAVTLWLLRGPGGAFSATSLITLLIGLPAFFLFRQFRSANQAIGICVLAAVIGVGGQVLMQVVFEKSILEVVAPMVGRHSNLTGRTDAIWAPLMAVALQHPVVGRGYGGYWITPIVLDKFSINQAHNGYLDIFIELGVVGLMLFSLVIVEFLIRSSKSLQSDRDRGAFLLTFLVMSLIHNITESSYLKTTSFFWAMFPLLLISAGAVVQRLRVPQESASRHQVGARTVVRPGPGRSRPMVRPQTLRKHGLLQPRSTQRG